MNFFFIKTIWSNLELSLIKTPVTAYGILLGIYYTEFLRDYIELLWIVFAVTAVWTIILWAKKMKATRDGKAW